MDWRWGWFWDILWSAFIHAVTFNWSGLVQDGENLKAWWRSLWDEITNRFSGTYSWVMEWVDWLRDQITYWYNRARTYAYDIMMWAYNTLSSFISSLESWARAQIGSVTDYAYSLYVAAVNWARSKADSVADWARGYVLYYVGVLRDQFGWIDDYYNTLVYWLANVRGAIDWLRWTAWNNLKAFLADPKGYVLGWLFSPITNVINWWTEHGQPLADFVSNDLAPLRNLLAIDLSFLYTLLSDPVGTILDALKNQFVDWACGVIADNW